MHGANSLLLRIVCRAIVWLRSAPSIVFCGTLVVVLGVGAGERRGEREEREEREERGERDEHEERRAEGVHGGGAGGAGGVGVASGGGGGVRALERMR